MEKWGLVWPWTLAVGSWRWQVAWTEWSKPEWAGWEQAFSSVMVGRWWEVKQGRSGHKRTSTVKTVGQIKQKNLCRQLDKLKKTWRPFSRLNDNHFLEVSLQFDRYIKESPLIKKSPCLTDLEVPVIHPKVLFSVFNLCFYEILTVSQGITWEIVKLINLIGVLWVVFLVKKLWLDGVLNIV